MDFLYQNHILTDTQHGTVAQPIEFTLSIAYLLDQGHQSDALFINFFKASDMVLHFYLLHKLHIILKNSRLVGCVASFLHNRSQYVDFSSIFFLHLVYFSVAIFFCTV